VAQSGALGEGMNEPAIGYLIVYHVEIALLFATLVALGPLVRADAAGSIRPDERRSGPFDPLVNRPT
jgi:BCD family chlorophyll transporter-like MFS transporter